MEMCILSSEEAGLINHAYYLRPVGEPDAPDLVGEARVGQRIDPSLDEPLLPAVRISTVQFRGSSTHHAVLQFSVQ